MNSPLPPGPNARGAAVAGGWGRAAGGGPGAEPSTAALGILVAAASNNVIRGLYATGLAGKKLGVPVLVALGTIGLAGVAVVAYLSRPW